MNSFTPLRDIEPVASILSQISIFGGVTESQRSAIFHRLQTGLLKKGQVVFQKGDEPSHIYIVKSGVIELLIPDEDKMIQKSKLALATALGMWL